MAILTSANDGRFNVATAKRMQYPQCARRQIGVILSRPCNMLPAAATPPQIKVLAQETVEESRYERAELAYLPIQRNVQ